MLARLVLVAASSPDFQSFLPEWRPELEYLVPNEWDLTFYKVFKSYLIPS